MISSELVNLMYLQDEHTREVKIADFGLSALVRLGDRYDSEESSKRKQFVDLKEVLVASFSFMYIRALMPLIHGKQMWGTKEYFAPELIAQAYGPQADVWAVGCVFYEMLCGRQAFGIRDHDTEESFYGRIQVPLILLQRNPNF